MYLSGNNFAEKIKKLKDMDKLGQDLKIQTAKKNNPTSSENMNSPLMARIPITLPGHKFKYPQTSVS